MGKELLREPALGSKISKVKFGLMSPQDMRQASHVQCCTPAVYQRMSKKPIQYGVLDARLGASISSNSCETCGKNFSECPGHFGYIDLAMPCFHIGYLRATLNVLKMICKTCSQMLMKEHDKEKFHASLKNPHIGYQQKKQIWNKILKLCSKNAKCQFCGSSNGMVKKEGPARIIHVRSKSGSKPAKEGSEETGSSLDAVKLQPDSTWECLNPIRVLNLFKAIRKADYILLGMEDECSSPKDLILTRILVPPACIRPSVVQETSAASSEDDLTAVLSHIIHVNLSIRNAAAGTSFNAVMESWLSLQAMVYVYITGEARGFDMRDARPLRGLVQRLKGKQGRFRGNLSGKRVDFSGRTVISPDPNLRIDEVAVPVLMAKIMTFPEKVTKANLNFLRRLIKNGPDVHPGANFVNHVSQNMKKVIKNDNKNRIIEDLRYGDIVERHMISGDVVLFNRQPSLHRLSIMCHFARVMPHRTLRFNECVCTPYNADFDGDEMNIHLPQTLEARAEALVLMGVKSNTVTPRNGEPLVAATQDFITGAYLLSMKDKFFDRAQFCWLISSILALDHMTARIDLPRPAIMKPVKLWTGKQVISTILRPNQDDPVKINLRAKGKAYTSNEELCSNDSFIVFYNSCLIAGTLDKNVIGSGSKNTIFYSILREYGEKQCADAMWKLARIAPFYLIHHGFSIGIADVTPGLHLLKDMDLLVKKHYQQCDEYISEFKEGRLQTQPGCTPAETLEAKILHELSEVRDQAGKLCLRSLPPTNSPLIMALCGSKGSNINISQMVACVGQQAISGKRIPDGFEGRSLPHFSRGSKAPAAKGFVKNSFYSGLTPTEFFFHTMAGREGLVDTAVKTAETGYIQRRLVKCLEDLSVQYDMTVRSSCGDIVQFMYGDDGLDPSCMEGRDSALDLDRLMNHSKCSLPDPGGLCLRAESARAIIASALSSDKLQKFNNLVVLDELRAYLDQTLSRLERSQQRLVLANKMRQSSVVQKLLDTYQADRLTETQLRYFLSRVSSKLERAVIEPGTAAGALCAQSIGEPGTQMTLKTFHFAGVATMNITLGVPRIKEIINATKVVSTPIITCQLEVDRDIEFARRVKARIERTTLGQITEFIEEVYLGDKSYLMIKLDENRIRLLQLEVTTWSIRVSICEAPKLKIKPQQVSILGPSILAVSPEDQGKIPQHFVMQMWKEALTNVVIKGFPSISRAIIHMDESGKGPDTKYKLFVEGRNMMGVMGIRGVKSSGVRSNSTFDVEQALGIEAARATIIHEIKYTMSSHGMSVDNRHLMLLGDLMTYRGMVLGITRNGLEKMKENILLLASFERTSDILFDAAFHGAKDTVIGVSESIITGMPMNIGTGSFKLLMRHEKPMLTRPKTPLFESLCSSY